jgi:hypothetical protein
VDLGDERGEPRQLATAERPHVPPVDEHLPGAADEAA